MTVGHRIDKRLAALVVLVAADAAFGPFSDAVYLVPVTTLFVVLGIPHGALDLWIFERAFTGNRRALFLAGYMLLVLFMFGLWWVSPLVAFATFIALSVHHFGEGDLPSGFVFWMRMLRGTFFVGLPLMAHISAVAPIVSAMGVPFTPSTHFASLLIGGIFVAQLPTILHPGWSTRRLQVEEFAYLVIWCIAFIRLPPLASFGLYFCLWHAIDHLKDIGHRFARPFVAKPAERWPLKPMSWLPYALAPNLVLLVFVALGLDDSWSVPRYAAYALMLTASLTLPHAVLVTLTRVRTTPEPRNDGEMCWAQSGGGT